MVDRSGFGVLAGLTVKTGSSERLVPGWQEVVQAWQKWVLPGNFVISNPAGGQLWSDIS
ncbi:hypothetical protein [Mycobacterium sp.]|uniref:hypothetical protein n=1 Tax=Mycobacterium sp. TaxID=1785 RepID=UPI003C71D972